MNHVYTAVCFFFDLKKRISENYSNLFLDLTRGQSTSDEDLGQKKHRSQLMEFNEHYGLLSL